jgi:hypothetical protein
MRVQSSIVGIGGQGRRPAFAFFRRDLGNMIELEDIVVDFEVRGQRVPAVDHVSLGIAQGEVFGIVGASGAGKSTLLRTINLLERPRAGRVVVAGNDITGLWGQALRQARQKTGMIFQHFNLMKNRTVYDNSAFVLRVGGKNPAEIAQRVPEILQLVGLEEKAQAIDADFFVFSGHKVFAPTGIGVVYGKRDILEDMPPWQGGGNMIADVTFERTLYQGVPARFEAGTGNIADAVGLGAAIDYVERIGIENISRYEHDLLAYATQRVQPIPGIRLIGTADDKASVLSFVLAGYRPEEVGAALNEEGIAVRAGHHCAQPILRRFGVEATVRPSLAFYNTCAGSRSAGIGAAAPGERKGQGSQLTDRSCGETEAPRRAACRPGRCHVRSLRP